MDSVRLKAPFGRGTGNDLPLLGPLKNTSSVVLLCRLFLIPANSSGPAAVSWHTLPDTLRCPCPSACPKPSPGGALTPAGAAVAGRPARVGPGRDGPEAQVHLQPAVAAGHAGRACPLRGLRCEPEGGVWFPAALGRAQGSASIPPFSRFSGRRHTTRPLVLAGRAHVGLGSQWRRPR